MPDSPKPAAVNGPVAPAPAQPPLPPLYQALEPLSPERHGALRLHDAGYGFAAQAHAVPLAAEEFSAAARHLPIVFAAQPPYPPLVLTGLKPGQNLFLDAKGGWRAGIYVPAYLRRYPFFLVRVSPESQQVALCLDPKAPQLSATEGEALFANGKPTPILERALNFSRAIEEAMLRTRAMAEGLAELGLLKPSVVQFMHEGKPMRIDGFHAVDRPALQALPAEKLALLRDRGWLEPIYAHLLSVGGLSELARDFHP